MPSLMEYKGFKAKIKKAPKLNNDRVHGLPPGEDIQIYPVDTFKKPLPHWITGAGNFVVPVKSDWGLWFDWTMNDSYNTAVLPTVKGMNPITGKKTEGFGLEKYEAKCPVHGETFKDGLYCEKCNFKWPYQNYVTAPNTLWWDGFRTADGKVRQFFFTEDLAKSIPELVIGKEETIPAFGFAFYSPKTPRVVRQPTGARGLSFMQDSFLHEVKTSGFAHTNNPMWQVTNTTGISLGNTSYVKCCDEGDSDMGTKISKHKGMADALLNHTTSREDMLNQLISGSMREISDFSLMATCCSSQPPVKKEESAFNLANMIQKKIMEVGVGAGAEINQQLQRDPLTVSEWQDEPAAVMRLYFIFEDQFKEVSAQGMNDLNGHKDGFMAGLPVGG
jgi:hypothetical protein